MKKPTPVWLLVPDDGRPFAISRDPAEYDDSVVRVQSIMGVRPILYVPAPTTKKRKAKKR